MQSFHHPFEFFPLVKHWRRWLLVLAVLSGLAGCGGGGSSSGVTSTTTATSVSLAGSVGDGPVTGATVTVYASDGSVLGTVVTDSTASFRSTVKARGNDYPLRLVVSGGTDLVTGLAPDFELVSLLQRPSDKQANINPFTTFVVQVAESLGGVDAGNVSQALGIVQQRLGFGLDPAQVPDPFTTEIDEGNVAQVVKASEALGELVRRVRDLTGAEGDRVVAALSADLVDGHLDGLGAAGAEARLSAVANVVSSQVLVETLSNSLRVGGVIATGVMDQSIMSTRPGITAGQLTGSVRVTQQLLEQSRTALAAAQVLDNSSAVQNIASTVDGISANSTVAQVIRVLPANSTNALATAVALVPGMTRTEISTINQLVFAYDDGATTVTASGTGTTTTTASTSTTTTTSTTSSSTTTTTTATGSGTTGGTSTTSGSLALRWQVPTTRSDGTPLSLAEIGGYRIYYGSSSGSYTGTAIISSGATQNTTIGNLNAGVNYYLAMTTVDTSGLESPRSPEISKVAQ